MNVVGECVSYNCQEGYSLAMDFESGQLYMGHFNSLVWEAIVLD